MIRNQSRLISTGSYLVRQLCSTPTETVSQRIAAPTPFPTGNEDKLYKRLSALGATGGSVTEALNAYIMEGKTVRKDMLEYCVRSLRKFGRYRHALEVIEWMESRKMHFSYTDFAVYLDLTAKTKGIAAAEEYFNGLSEYAKNRYTYGALLNCYCKELMTERALALFEKMDELKFLGNTVAFNNLSTMYLRLGQPEKVRPLVNQMKQRNISLDNLTYIVWMQSYSHLNDIDGVERVFYEMCNECEDKCRWTTYSNLASIYVKAELFEKAELALKKLEEMKPRDRKAYHFLISLYCNTSNLDAVNRVWGILKSTFPPTNTSYLVLLQALAKLNAIDILKQCFEEWESRCSSYDMRLADVIIRAYLQKDMYEEAALIFNNAKKRANASARFFKSRESFMIYYLRSRQLDLALNEMEAALSEAKQFHWRPMQVTVDTFFRFFEEEKDVDGAEEFCKVLKSLNCLDFSAYSLLIKTYIAAGKLASDMRQRLEDDDIEITDELEDLLVKVCPP